MTSYKDIISCVESDFKSLDKNLKFVLEDNSNSLNPKLASYLFSSSKRIRSGLIFLLARALGGDIEQFQLKIASATELVHNATLIHDDVIDDSSLRRGNETINSEFDSKLAVIAGDFLLTLALNELQSVQNTKVLEIFTDCLKQVCMGEIGQFFGKNKLISIEEYIEKSKNKTAMLFKAALLSSCAKSENLELLKDVEKFAENFGIAFQIRDDLINIINIDDSKPFQDDIKNGIFNAPLIYLADDNPELLHNSFDEIILKLKESDVIHKTRGLLNKYIESAIDALNFLDDNIYKESIVNLCKYIGKVE